MIFLKYLNYACKIIIIPKQIPTQNGFYLVIHFLSSTTNVILHPLNTHFSRLIPRPVYTLFSQQRSDSFEKLFKHLELVSHQDIQTLENNNKNPHVFIHCFLVFGYPGETLALVVQILREMLRSGVAYRTRTVLRILLGLQMIHY